jgi:hypothetical protein
MEYMFSPKEAGRANQEVQFGKVASQVGRFFDRKGAIGLYPFKLC